MATGSRTIRVVLKDKQPIRIEDVYFVPKLDRRLLSISAFSPKVLLVTFQNISCMMRNDKEVVTQSIKKGKLFVLEM